LTVPVELTERALRDALAVVGEHDLDAARTAEAALAWIGWERHGPLLLRRYDVQLLVWYALPHEVVPSLELKREAAAALARTLEYVGGRAATYAQVCRAPETEQLLCAWEDDDPDAWRRFRELLEGSGLEPPDTDLLAWSQMMGPAEARVREQVATALEVAIEDGRLTPGATGFRRRQAQVAKAALREPWEEDDALTRLQVVQAERLERWLAHGRWDGGPERRAILEPVAAVLFVDTPPIEPVIASNALAPALWLLERGQDGIALTKTGALNRALVREVVKRWPGWWYREPSGPPYREDDVALLRELHALLLRSGLFRRTGRQIITTRRGRKLRDDPAALLAALSGALLGGEGFAVSCAELASALILSGAIVDYSGAIAAQIHPAILAEGWRYESLRPTELDVRWALMDFLRRAEAIGLVELVPGTTRLSSGHLALTAAGLMGLVTALRARALAPITTP
jgi:hypothetical protein